MQKQNLMGFYNVVDTDRILEIHPTNEQSSLTITQGFVIGFEAKRPNWFWRMWQYLLLGWRWK